MVEAINLLFVELVKSLFHFFMRGPKESPTAVIPELFFSIHFKRMSLAVSKIILSSTVMFFSFLQNG